jgi:MFS family permease
MTTHELKTIISLTLIMVLRMMGLFMILPVFSLYASHLPHATPLLIGITLGIYGLTQGLLQLPFGMLSDRFGRKTIIACGLGIFCFGSLIAANAHSIYGILVGRALQGAGAIGSTILALLADNTSEKHRTIAMAIFGSAIGLSFALAFIVGPILTTWFSIRGIFYLTSIMAILAILILFILVPTPATTPVKTSNMQALLSNCLKNTNLLRLDASIFILHAILTASFIALPIMLANMLHIPQQHQWTVYCISLVAAFICMVPAVSIAEKKRLIKPFFLGAILVLCLSQLTLLVAKHSLILTTTSLWLFFTGFTFLEATLPSWISKIAPSSSKGTAMGIYSSSQFLGIFSGGIIGGWLYGHYQENGIFLFSALLALFWWRLAKQLTPQTETSTLGDHYGKRYQ